MNDNEMKFGKFVEQKLKEQGITLRGLSGELDLAPSYELHGKVHRYPSDKCKM